jgi:hypothetical protein
MENLMAFLKIFITCRTVFSDSEINVPEKLHTVCTTTTFTMENRPVSSRMRQRNVSNMLLQRCGQRSEQRRQAQPSKTKIEAYQVIVFVM